MEATPEDWEKKFAAIARLHDEADSRVATDPLSAALRARQVIEHIADYLQMRELGPPPPGKVDMLDAKLKRLDMKGVLPRHVAVYIGTVQIHTNSVIHTEQVPRDLTPDELEPCLKSLHFVVDWFFRQYLKRPSPQRAQGAQPPPVATPRPADASGTPINLGTSSVGGTSVGTGIGEIVLVWRGNATPSTLQFDPTDGGLTERVQVRLANVERQILVGRQPKRPDGSDNDVVIPHTSVSGNAGSLVLRDHEVVLTNTSNRDNVFVRAERLAAGRSRALRHGDVVQFGAVVGSFLDGRYYASATPAFVDVRTGLLSREGLVAEIGRALVTRTQRTLFVLRCTPERGLAEGASQDPELVASQAALALHTRLPAVPVGRIGASIAAIVESAAEATRWVEAFSRETSSGFVSGYRVLEGPSDQAIAILEGSVGALSRLALTGREQIAPVDLSSCALALTSIAAFADRTRPLFELGGGAVLFALGDAEQLERLAPQAIPVLEHQLIEMLGARVGPRDIVSVAGAGRILFGTPGDPDRLAHEVGVAWHARGPVTVNALEFDRALSAHLLTQTDLLDLRSRVDQLAKGGVGALGLEGFPAPIALAGAMLDNPRPADAARRLLRVVETSWKFLALVLVAAARAAKAPAAPDSREPRAGWPAPWRALAKEAASRLVDQHPHVQKLVSITLVGDSNPAVKDALDFVVETDRKLESNAADAAIEPLLPRLERAVREIVGTFAPLRGWTLVSVDSSEVVDLDGVTQRIEYVDYTGPSARGALERVTVSGFKGLGRFVYLVRWPDSLAIALEPFAKRARNPVSGDDELFVVEAPITAAGGHRYGAVGGAGAIEIQVSAKQLGL